MTTTEIYSLENLQAGPDSLTATVRYDAAHAVFTGHFPDNPIVPGVCTLNMITDVVQGQFGADYQFDTAAFVKFLQLIRPDHVPTLRLSWKGSSPELHVQATLELDGVMMMRFNGTYRRS